MPLSTTDSEAAAVEGFLRSRRGTCELRDHVVASLYCTCYVLVCTSEFLLCCGLCCHR